MKMIRVSLAFVLAVTTGTASAQGVFGDVPTLDEIIDAGGVYGNEGRLFGPVPTLDDMFAADGSSGLDFSVFGPVPTYDDFSASAGFDGSILGPVPTWFDIIDAGEPFTCGHFFGPVPRLGSDGVYTDEC